jgi:Cu+-exporting ATPase
MDVLISIGICAGYVASVISLFLGISHEMIFFEATSSIVTFVLIGHLLEERAVKKTTSAIEGLAALQPLTAQRLARAGEVATSKVETITLEEIGIGDLLQVNTGDVVPTDAIVEHGSLSCNEMMLSGESLPVEKSSGSRVIGGSTVVDGSASIRAVAIGDDTTLASIIHLVQDAQQRKPEIQRIGDAVSAIFVPAVVITSAVVLIAGMLFFNLSLAQAIVRALAIAVVACPCAMGLATPTAIMVALGKAANSGILIRGGDTLERLAAVKAMAFDKTGTLTTGELAVGRMQVYEDVSESEAKGIIATLQRNSSHPIAKSLVRAFAGSPSTLTLTNVTETRGVGLEATGSDGAHYVCGGSRVKERFSIQEPGDLVLVKNGVLAASIYLQDSIRSEAFTAIDALRSMIPSLSVISGDYSAKVKQVGEALGIADLHSEQLPEQKLALIRALQASNPIAYVGDGINDAPTLTEASVGISLSSASDVAVNSAQVILSGNSLQSLPKALQLARLTVRTIKQNLFWAFLYNVIAIPLAAFGYIAPLTGALLMTFSDVIIVSNSLRIKFFKLR